MQIPKGSLMQAVAPAMQAAEEAPTAQRARDLATRHPHIPRIPMLGIANKLRDSINMYNLRNRRACIRASKLTQALNS